MPAESGYDVTTESKLTWIYLSGPSRLKDATIVGYLRRCTSSLMGIYVDRRSQMIRRFPSRFRGVAVWTVLLACWSIPTAGQQNVLPRATATISGKISFEGVPPENSPVQMFSDPYCQMHSADYPTLETVKVSDGRLENVIRYVSSGLTPGVAYTAPTTPIELDYLNCHYIPHVFTMMTQQGLNIRNSDMTLHNIHVWSEKNPQFNVGQPVMNMVHATTFAYPEMPLVIRDDVHRWGSAFVGVFDHPFHTVSKSGGLFELKLPPGYYEITAWHEKYGQKTMMVGVVDNERRVINITFAPNDK